MLSAAKSNNPYYQSKVFICNQWAYADNQADAVDQLLIFYLPMEELFPTGNQTIFPRIRYANELDFRPGIGWCKVAKKLALK